MKISVLMSTYKEDISLLRESIESILNQTYKDFEFIIILDNPDNKEHIKCIQEYAEKDSRIRFSINEMNMGLTPTLNKGIQLAKGEYICRMDADDISEIDRIEKEYDYLVSHQLDLVGCLSMMIDEQGNTLYQIKKVPSSVQKIKKCLKYNQVISHPTWLGKKEMFKDLNGYRQIPLCEDTDFTLRAILKGYKIGNINQCLLRYRLTKDSISRTHLYEQYLYLKYITKAYRKNEIADIKNAKEYVERHKSEKKINRFLKANQVFNEALYALENKNYLTVMGKCFHLLFISKDYLGKIYRLVRVSL